MLGRYRVRNRSKSVPFHLLGETAAPAFSPDDIAELELWLDAADTNTITDSADTVSAWADKSSNQLSVVSGSGTQPLTNTDNVNGLNVLRFVDNGFMTLPSAINTIANGSNTIVVAYQKTENVAVAMFLGDDGTGNEWEYQDGEPGFNPFMKHGNNGNNEFVSMDLPNTLDFTIGAARRNGTFQDICRNGGTLVTANNAVNIAALNNTFRLGHWRGTQWSIAEIMFFSKDLSDSELNQVGNYLKDKWAATWTDVGA